MGEKVEEKEGEQGQEKGKQNFSDVFGPLRRGRPGGKR
jgi:hypothetical protein